MPALAPLCYRKEVVRMEIKIRDVDPTIVKRIDQNAKDKGLSRNAYLKQQLESFAIINGVKNDRVWFEEVLRQVREVLESNYYRLEQLEKQHERMLFLLSLITNVDMEDVNAFLGRQ